jgi:uncharacterized protein (DUF1499 family)
MQARAVRIASVLVKVGTIITVLSALTAMSAGPASDAGLWTYRTGFVIVRWSVYVAAGAGAIALIAGGVAAESRQYRTALVGIVTTVIALAVIVPAWQLQRTASQVPRIHDITTDTDNPPSFVALLPVRQKTPNGPEYDGDKIARQQKAAYPDIQPVMLAEPPTVAFERALAAARSMGWEIVAAVAGDGRIEATATTRWFRFKDDIVIRVMPQPSGSRIDVRSKSRLGHSDLGTNARRIRAYVRALDATR